MTRRIKVGSVDMGGGAPVSIQSMLKADIFDTGKIEIQLMQLKDAGCDIVRVAVPNMDAAGELSRIKNMAPMPVVADIHFDWKLAVRACEAGVDKIRINPGNIGSADGVKAVATACKERGIPIRIGVNSGSLEKQALQRCGGDRVQAMVDSALVQAEMLEEYGFSDICISLKSSGVAETIRANRMLSQKCDYPVHIGVTEAGTVRAGTLKSAIGIGALLCEGIGDTVRVSLTDEPWKEVEAAKDILDAVGVRRKGVNLISCPTCGRTRIDLFSLVKQVEDALGKLEVHGLTVAVMGCVVNGPGEASHADYGIAGGEDCGVIFAKGKIIEKLPQDKLAEGLIDLIRKENK
ncbi:MAG: flavodoxin-dependent (E)-4-hydroxy-3-methylbut-2-enyl-diphosphate synthase [Oscillospiraceae bacterium]|nr:flavodoxin-dependent (E)-4-hydroxy-3-methylbut-2-enyl-diphosphate synthase [Oscillospiraceae bacterium]